MKGGTLNGGAEGGHTGTGDATGNTVLIDSGTVLDHIYGGFTGSGSATGNFITVTGGTVNAVVAGGYDDGTTTDNTVTLYDTAVYTGSELYGGLNAGPSPMYSQAIRSTFTARFRQPHCRTSRT